MSLLISFVFAVENSFVNRAEAVLQKNKIVWTFHYVISSKHENKITHNERVRFVGVTAASFERGPMLGNTLFPVKNLRLEQAVFLGFSVDVNSFSCR